MTIEFFYTTLQQYQLAVLATLSSGNQPHAALIGFAVTPELEIVFDTLKTSRKYLNLLASPRVALVIGWENEITIQYEGEACELVGAGNNSYKETYYSAFPEGRQRAANSPELTYFIIRPVWVRYSNFNEPSRIEEMAFDERSSGLR